MTHHLTKKQLQQIQCMEFHTKSIRKMNFVINNLSLPNRHHYKNALKELEQTQQTVHLSSSFIGLMNNAFVLHVTTNVNQQMVASYTKLYKAMVLLTLRYKKGKLTVVLRFVRMIQNVLHSSLMSSIYLPMTTARFGLLKDKQEEMEVTIQCVLSSRTCLLQPIHRLKLINQKPS